MKYLSRIAVLAALSLLLAEGLSAQRRVSRGSSRSYARSYSRTNSSTRYRSHQPRSPRLRRPQRRAPVVCHGHREARQERVWVEGARRRVWVPAQYGWRLDLCGLRIRYRICDGRYEIVQDPGSWQIVTKYVWVRRQCCG